MEMMSAMGKGQLNEGLRMMEVAGKTLQITSLLL